MAKGDGISPPMCRNCGEAHWRVHGEVCPKFQRQGAKIVKQPDRLRLPPPPKPAAPAAAKPAKVKAKVKKPKKEKRA